MDEFPQFSTPPPDVDDWEAPSDSRILSGRRIVAICVGDAALHATIQQVLVECDSIPCSADILASASTIITDARAGIAQTIAELRAQARSDAAIVVVIDEPYGPQISEAHRAGAFAYLRQPIVPEELSAIVDSASQSQSARRQIADLTKRLDLDTHLASIGRISAGLSHEIASPLSATIANVELLREELGAVVNAREHLRALAFAPIVEHEKRALAARTFLEQTREDGSLLEALADVETSLQRIRKLLETMKKLVRQQRRELLASTDLAVVVHDVCKWAVSHYGERATIEKVIDAPVAATADRTLLEQILTNLVSNAVHAAAKLPSPRVRVHVYRSGHEAIVSVRDNGPGIAPCDHEKIFEPFYTTRREEGGTGLGLALCREYAIQMRAKLTLWSVPRRGACFRVRMALAPHASSAP